MMGMPTPDGFDIFNFVRDYLCDNETQKLFVH
jgi:hypothetical protein